MSITKEQIAEFIDRNVFYPEGGYGLSHFEMQMLCEDSAKHLAPKWVSVDDRLPSGSYAHVLVCCEGGNVDRTFYCTDRNFLASSRDAGYYSRKQHGKNSGYFELSHKFGYKITHWMPLPEPPK